MEDTTPEQNKNQNNTINGSLVHVNYSDNDIHSTAIIGKDVILGKGNKIGAYCVITGKTIIGNNNTIESFYIFVWSGSQQHFVIFACASDARCLSVLPTNTLRNS